MLKILIAKINILSSNKKINIKIKQNYILTLSKDIFTITTDKTIKPIIAIKEPLYIKLDIDNEVIVKDIKKDNIYEIQILELYDSIELKDNILSNNIKSIHIEEEDIKSYILNHFTEIFPKSKIIKTEYKTPYGDIDILAIDKNGIYQIIELKKKSTDFKTIDQVLRYGEYFLENNKDIELFVLGVNENKKNKEYALEKNVKIININKKNL